MTRSTLIYRGVAHVLGRTVFSSPDIASVCVRRSVATGEATFPFSDLDFDISVAADAGLLIGRVLRRLRLARAVFPRTGQCFVITQADVEELADLEPYRASINRRSGIAVRGSAPEWPARPIDQCEAARRVVFWLESYFPQAVRTGNHRLQRKCRLEMRNALGLLDRRWNEPRITQQEVRSAYPLSATRSLFADGLEAAGAAHAHLGRAAPAISAVVQRDGLTLLPALDAPWPHDARGIVVTPQALDVMLQTLRPSLWLEHGEALAGLGFEPPPVQAWIREAWRLASVQWLRGPGFFEPRSALQEWRLTLAEHVLTAVEHGGVPTRPVPPPARVRERAFHYYAESYDVLVPRAAALRARARALGAAAVDGATPGVRAAC
jgi:hypothetical protein